MNKMYQILLFTITAVNMLAVSSLVRADNTQGMDASSALRKASEEQVIANLKVNKELVDESLVKEVTAPDLSNAKNALDEKITKSAPALSEQTLIHYRELFKQAEEALNKRDEEAYFLLADQ